jgi:hypothetical protein
VHDDRGDGLGRLGVNQPRLRFSSGRPRSLLAGARCSGQTRDGPNAPGDRGGSPLGIEHGNSAV